MLDPECMHRETVRPHVGVEPFGVVVHVYCQLEPPGDSYYDEITVMKPDDL